MSHVDLAGEKVELSREHPTFWTDLEAGWAGVDPQRWKCLAALTLFEVCGWTTEMIGRAFGHHKGHISRLIAQAKEHVRERFTPQESQEFPRIEGFPAICSG